MNQTGSESESEESSTSSSSEGDQHQVHAHEVLSSNPDHEDAAQIYRSAIVLNDAVSSTHSVTKWPPTASSLTDSGSTDIVPPLLFNFIAWCTGLHNDFSTQRVEVHDHADRLKCSQSHRTSSPYLHRGGN